MFSALPEQASTQAVTFDRLFWVMSGFSIFIVTLVGTLILVFSVRFRAKTKAPRRSVKALESRRIEIFWISATAFFAIFFF